MERNDIHRPGVIKPSEYQFVAFNYIGGNDLGALMRLKTERERLRAHQEKTGGKMANHIHGGTCHICGALALYLVIWYHAPSNEYIESGEDCARKMDMSYDEGQFNYFRKSIHIGIEAIAGKKKAAAFLESISLSQAWNLYLQERPQHSEDCINNAIGCGKKCTCGVQEYQYEEETILDIVSKLVRYGSISAAQQNLIRKLFAQIDNRATVEAQREVERAAAADCPSGRIVIEGTVLGMKSSDTQFGTVTRILVQHDSGWKVWGTRIANFKKGERVRFKATITVSPDDTKFGFFKRPSNPERFMKAGEELWNEGQPTTLESDGWQKA